MISRMIQRANMLWKRPTVIARTGCSANLPVMKRHALWCSRAGWRRRVAILHELGSAAQQWPLPEQGYHLSDVLRHWQLLGRFRQAHPAIGMGQHRMLSQQPYVFERSRQDRVATRLRDRCARFCSSQPIRPSTKFSRRIQRRRSRARRL